MRRFLRLTARGVGAFFGSPMTYVVLTGFYLLVGFLFRTYMVSARTSDLAPFVEQVQFLLVLVIPVCTMRVLSDDLRTGALELLYVRQIGPLTIVAARFVASLVFGLVAIGVPTVLVFAFGVSVAGSDPGILAAQITGLLFVLATLVAIGVAASALSPNPLVAALGAEIVGLFLWFLNLADAAPAWAQRTLSLRPHLDGFALGALRLEDAVFFVTLIPACLASATAALRFHRS